MVDTVSPQTTTQESPRQAKPRLLAEQLTKAVPDMPLVGPALADAWSQLDAAFMYYDERYGHSKEAIGPLQAYVREVCQAAENTILGLGDPALTETVIFYDRVLTAQGGRGFDVAWFQLTATYLVQRGERNLKAIAIAAGVIAVYIDMVRNKRAPEESDTPIPTEQQEPST